MEQLQLQQQVLSPFYRSSRRSDSFCFKDFCFTCYSKCNTSQNLNEAVVSLIQNFSEAARSFFETDQKLGEMSKAKSTLKEQISAVTTQLKQKEQQVCSYTQRCSRTSSQHTCDTTPCVVLYACRQYCTRHTVVYYNKP